MIDHVGIRVSDYTKSKQFYEAALAPLGYKLLMEYGGATGGFGEGNKPDFWIGTEESTGAVHVAFASESREVVDAFHRAALAAGGRDNGAPGPRPQYHAGYYGAFILDPDGHNIEVVCHRPA